MKKVCPFQATARVARARLSLTAVPSSPPLLAYLLLNVGDISMITHRPKERVGPLGILLEEVLCMLHFSGTQVHFVTGGRQQRQICM